MFSDHIFYFFQFLKCINNIYNRSTILTLYYLRTLHFLKAVKSKTYAEQLQTVFYIHFKHFLTDCFFM